MLGMTKKRKQVNEASIYAYTILYVIPLQVVKLDKSHCTPKGAI